MHKGDGSSRPGNTQTKKADSIRSGSEDPRGGENDRSCEGRSRLLIQAESILEGGERSRKAEGDPEGIGGHCTSSQRHEKWGGPKVGSEEGLGVAPLSKPILGLALSDTRSGEGTPQFLRCGGRSKRQPGDVRARNCPGQCKKEGGRQKMIQKRRSVSY